MPVALLGCLTAWICANLTVLGLSSPLSEATHISDGCMVIAVIAVQSYIVIIGGTHYQTYTQQRASWQQDELASWQQSELARSAARRA